jgi:YfiH family protein
VQHTNSFATSPQRAPSFIFLHGLEYFQTVMAFSTRLGGVSPVPFDSLNFSASEGDMLENVITNLREFCNQICIEPDSLFKCHQVHGDGIAIADSELADQTEADAIITSSPGFFPTVRTADCLPILAIDPVQKVSAAIHAGWRGTIQRISRKVIRTLARDFGTLPADLIVALGPSIKPCCYEVDQNVLEPFHHYLPWAESCTFTLEQLKKMQNSWHIGSAIQLDLGPKTKVEPIAMKPTRPAAQSFRIDLARANHYELLNEGVLNKNIYITDLCTACYRELFFSHRRDGQRTGRHIAIVGFKQH